MRRILLCLIVGVIVLVNGCADSAGTVGKTTPDSPGNPVGKGRDGNTETTVKSTTSTPAGGATEANIPANAKYTIAVALLRGPGHESLAGNAKERLIQQTRRNDVFVVHDPAGSTLYLGYYAEQNRQINPAEAARIQADLAMLGKIVDAQNQRVYRSPLSVPLPSADPVAPPEWNLVNLDRGKPIQDPNRIYWSLAIAAYTSDARGVGADTGKTRKQLAVESVAQARENGIEAYYFHGDNISTVCIGAWPRRAIREQDTNQARHDDDHGDLVVSTTPLPPGMANQISEEKKDVKVVQPQLDVLDSSMLQTWQRFPTYAVDGEEQVNVLTDPRTGARTARPQPSFLVEIPKVQNADMLDLDHVRLIGNEDRSMPDLDKFRRPSGTGMSGLESFPERPIERRPQLPEPTVDASPAPQPPPPPPPTGRTNSGGKRLKSVDR